MLNYQSYGIVFHSWNTLILHWSFWGKLCDGTFQQFLRENQLIFIQILKEIDLIRTMFWGSFWMITLWTLLLCFLLTDFLVALSGSPCYFLTPFGISLFGFCCFCIISFCSYGNFIGISQLSIDYMKTQLYWVLSQADFSIMPRQKWWLIQITLNVKDVVENVFNLLMNLMNFLHKIVAGKFNRSLSNKPKIRASNFWD